MASTEVTIVSNLSFSNFMNTLDNVLVSLCENASAQREREREYRYSSACAVRACSSEPILFVAFIEDNATMSLIRYFANLVSFFGGRKSEGSRPYKTQFLYYKF